ncbi:MAG: methyltransferase domain-containing protein, partial [Woeseiaceae bacterium]|nr:methyltransferase domain-containing protein [Woeseiaceae bacterium]
MGYQVNIGCGQTPTEDWINFDNSPAIKLAKSPLKLRLAKMLGLLTKPQIENIEWLKKNTIEYADATIKIPLLDNSVITLYSSHMFEHLSRDGGVRFLQEVKRVLVSDGVVRIVIPDLEKAISRYNKEKNADEFMESILVSAPPISSLIDKVRLIFSGYRHHQWMFDGDSLAKLMKSQGFRNVTIQISGNTLIENPGNLNLF